MIGLLIALGLGCAGKWRWLGYAYLVDLLVIGAAGLLRGSGDAELVAILLAPLAEVSLGYGLGAIAHRMRRGVWPRDKSVAQLPSIERATDDAGNPILSWEIETPMLTRQIASVLGIVIGILFVFLAAIFSLIGRGGPFFGMATAAIGCAGLIGLFALVVFGLFFNRLRRRCRLTESGYAAAITDPRMFAGIAAAGTASAKTRGAVGTGSALAGAATMCEARAWDAIAKARPDPARHRIHLRIRGLGRLGRDTIFCHAEGYESVAAYVAERTGRSKSGAPIATEPDRVTG